MTFINNLSMRGKLITLVLPALLVISFFALQSIFRSVDDRENMQQLQTMVQLAELGDPLVEALQKERGRSAVFLSAAGNRMANVKRPAPCSPSDRTPTGTSQPTVQASKHWPKLPASTAPFRPVWTDFSETLAVFQACAVTSMTGRWPGPSRAAATLP